MGVGKIHFKYKRPCSAQMVKIYLIIWLHCEDMEVCVCNCQDSFVLEKQGKAAAILMALCILLSISAFYINEASN